MSLDAILREIKARVLPTTIERVMSYKTILATTDYAAEDVVSDNVLWKFSNIARKEGGSGLIVNAFVSWETTSLTPRLSLFLFMRVPSCTVTDNAANTATVWTDVPVYIGKIDYPALEDLGTGTSEAEAAPSTVGNLPMMFKCASGSKDLYGILVTRDAITGETAGNKMAVRLVVEQF